MIYLIQKLEQFCTSCLGIRIASLLWSSLKSHFSRPYDSTTAQSFKLFPNLIAVQTESQADLKKNRFADYNFLQYA